MIAAVKTAITALFGNIPIAFWLATIGIAAAAFWHFSEVRDAREQSRLEIKAAIEAEAAKTGREADAATRGVLACRGTWNRDAGRCAP